MGFSLFGSKKNADRHGFEELSPEQQEIIKEERRNMIRGVEDLSETAVKEVMVPRIDVDFIALDTPIDELMAKIQESGHSRFPVYSESIDNVTGVLYVKDLIYWFRKKDEPFNLECLIRKAYFVPESKRIDSLLREFKRRHLHIAIAIDEYGGIAGIITMEDIIEEIVGDIQDEFDNEHEDILSIGSNMWLCEARIDLDNLNEALKADFPASDFDSLGGFVFDLFGRIPVTFEKVSWGGYDFVVQDMEEYRINRIKVIKRTEEKESGDEKDD